MELLVTVLLLLVCLLISNVISHYLPYIPTALTQIAFGILIAVVFTDFSLPLETDWFLLLFVAPLLYNDGRRFDRDELWRMRAPIFGNAVILVLLTTVGGGYFIHWLIEDIPLAAAFALAAILSPTDPVAVNGIAQRIKIPEKVLNLVRGESLINDASGLVAFNYAVAAVVTGYFSLKAAMLNFTYMFTVGMLAGLVLGLLIRWIQFSLRRNGIHDVTFHSLLQILTPFLIYMAAEEMLHASGVIAVVAGGIFYSIVSERTETLNAEEQVLTENIWSITLFVLNGFVFLLLGLNIPSSIADTVTNPNIGNWHAVFYVVAIGLVILGIRFVWSYVLSFTESGLSQTMPKLRTSLLISLTGVRGTVTMAGVLSIPFVIEDGNAFPERSLILFLAAGVIMFTLVIATVCLPLLSKKNSSDADGEQQIDINDAKRKILLGSIQAIRAEASEENKSATYDLLNEYKMMLHRIRPEHEESDLYDYQEKMTALRLLALKAERKYIQDVMERNGMDEATFAAFERSLNLREGALATNARTRIMYLIRLALRAWLHYRYRRRPNQSNNLHVSKQIQMKALQAGLDTVADLADKQDRPVIVQAVINDYKEMIDQLKRPSSHYNEKVEEQKEEFRIKLMDKERSHIHEMYKGGEITSEQAKQLRRFINHMESLTLGDFTE